MPNPIDGYVEPVRRSRRAAVRAVGRIEAGSLGPEEVDFCDLLFGQVGPEEKLAKLGLLDDGGHCDVLVAEARRALKEVFDAYAPVADLSKHLEAAFPRVKERLDRRPPVEVGSGPLDAARNDRNNERVAARAAGVLAVHLCQRAMYEALGSVLRDLVSDQIAFQEHGKVVAKVHGPLRMDREHVEASDVSIEKVRRPHLADRRVRPESFAPALGPVDGSSGEPVDYLAQALGIAAE